MAPRSWLWQHECIKSYEDRRRACVHLTGECGSAGKNLEFGRICGDIAQATVCTLPFQQRMSSMKHVVIVGGGFAGLSCARKLASKPGIHVTLIDKNNYQQFQPLLYQVATALLAPDNAAFSLRSLLRGHANIDVKMAEVISGDLKTRTVKTADGNTYQSDFLILAAGAQANFFGTPGANKYGYALYSLRDAQLLRSRILMLIESVDRDPSLINQGALNFVVVGAGPTGTETSGSLEHLIQTAR